MTIIRPETNAGLPFYQLVLRDIFGPPIMTGAWWLLAGGLSTAKNRVVQNATDRVAFLTILALSYFVAISITIYARYLRH